MMTTTKYLSNKRWLLLCGLTLFLALVVLLVEFRYISGARLISDESFNFRQITRFLKGDFSMEPAMNLIPGYHALIAAVMFVFHKTGLFSARFFSMVISFISICIFCLLAWKVSAESSPSATLVKTLQYTFFPLFFPFFPLVYTDVLALMLVLLAFALVLWKHYSLAGIVGIFSVLARTNNISWFAFLLVFIYYENYGIDLRAPFRSGEFARFLKRTWVYWLGAGMMLAFLVANKGIAISDPNMQPLFKFQTGNLILALFLFFLFFLPLNLANFPRILRLLWKYKWLLLVLLGVYVVYMLTFQDTHPFNQFLNPPHYLRNRLLQLVTSGPLLKTLFFLPVAYGLLSLAVTRLREARFYWLYPFTVLSLAPFWLIEPRYSFVPFALFLLFKEERSPVVEWLTVIFYILLSTVMVYFLRPDKFLI